MEMKKTGMVIPPLPHQATIAGRIVQINVAQPPTWIDVVQEIQRWS